MRLQRETNNAERTALRDWLDLFNHRFVSLFFRAWEKYRFPFRFEQAAGPGEDDPFTNVLRCYVGIGMAPLRSRLRVVARDDPSPRAPRRQLAAVDDLSLLYYAGFLAHRPRNAVSLQGLLGDYFDLDARVLQFHGQWLAIEPEGRTRLGGEASSNQLGVSAIAGDRVWDVRSKIRLRLGPLSYERFRELVPDPAPVAERKAFYLLSHLVRLYAGPEVDFDVQLVLRAAEVPECRLGDEDDLGPRLGWNTWLRSEPMDRDPDDAAFEGQELREIEPPLAV